MYESICFRKALKKNHDDEIDIAKDEIDEKQKLQIFRI